MSIYLARLSCGHTRKLQHNDLENRYCYRCNMLVLVKRYDLIAKLKKTQDPNQLMLTEEPPF